MLPSKGKPNPGAAARLMVPVILEALHNIDNEKKTKERHHTRIDEKPIATSASE